MSDGLLPSNEVHLWFCPLDEAKRAGQLESCLEILDESEKGLLDKRLGKQSQADYAISHAFLRTTLSHYCADVLPADWRFDSNEYGRPFVDSPARRLHFSLSRTTGLIVVGIRSEDDLGVDVELVQASSEHMGLAEQYFAASEVAALQSVDELQRAQEFYSYWTLKESYVKALGVGMSLSLASFAFHQEPGGGPHVRSTDSAGEASGHWHFGLMALEGKYRVALSVHRANARDVLEVRTYQSLPFGESQDMDLSTLRTESLSGA